MLDSHAHPYDANYPLALVCTDTLNVDISSLTPYSYKAVGCIAPNLDSFSEERAYSLIDGDIMIGEVGLDSRFGNLERQMEVFKAFLRIAREKDKLITMHIVHHWDRAYSMIKESKIRRFIIHGYSGSYEMAKRFISIGGTISLNRRALKLRDFDKLLSLPFLTESDMKTGKEEYDEIVSWNKRLSEMLNKDIGNISETLLKDLING